MKNIIVLIIFIIPLFLGCSTVNGIKYGDRKGFSKKDLNSISEYYFSDKEKPTHLFINEIIIDKKKKVGLYGLTYKNLTNPANFVHKILKLEDSFYIYLENDQNQNKEMLKEFKRKYSHLFTTEDFKILVNSFNRGTDFNTRLW